MATITITNGAAVSGNQAVNIGTVTVDQVTGEVEIKNDTGSPVPVNAVNRNCVGRQTLSVTTGAVSTLTIPGGAASALIQSDGSAISITFDGVTAPTATIGVKIDDGMFQYVDTPLANVKMIARSATTNVQVVYYDKA